MDGKRKPPAGRDREDLHGEKIRRLEEENRRLSAEIVDLKLDRRNLQKTCLETLRRLTLTAVYKDDDTGAHIVRVTRYSVFLARTMGFSPDELFALQYAAGLHDIGKIGIPDTILFKPGHLTPEEFEIMKCHTLIGAKILSGTENGILLAARTVARSHHEKWDGQGYPDGLSGESIPLPARIVAIADAFDAMTSKRPYRSPLSVEAAVAIIRREKERHFDPAVAGVFLEYIQEIVKIKALVDSTEDAIRAEWTEDPRVIHLKDYL